MFYTNNVRVDTDKEMYNNLFLAMIGKCDQRVINTRSSFGLVRFKFNKTVRFQNFYSLFNYMNHENTIRHKHTQGGASWEFQVSDPGWLIKLYQMEKLYLISPDWGVVIYSHCKPECLYVKV